MNPLSRWFVRRASDRLRPLLASFGLLQTVKIKPALLWNPGKQRVLVLSPHMDDEVIGCGGAIAKHVKNGATVTVVFLTDGRWGAVRQALGKEERGRQRRKLVETRKREAAQCLVVLGVQEGVYLDAVETRLSSDPTLCTRLRRIIDEIRPDLVYLPFFLEEHPDHRETSRVLLDATEGRAYRFDCYGYEVWTPLLPNCLVDITDEVDLKRHALSCYKSQLADKDYIHTSLGLNAYRSSSLLQRGGYVEAFYMAGLEAYRHSYGEFLAMNSGS